MESTLFKHFHDSLRHKRFELLSIGVPQPKQKSIWVSKIMGVWFIGRTWRDISFSIPIQEIGDSVLIVGMKFSCDEGIDLCKKVEFFLFSHFFDLLLCYYFFSLFLVLYFIPWLLFDLHIIK